MHLFQSLQESRALQSYFKCCYSCPVLPTCNYMQITETPNIRVRSSVDIAQEVPGDTRETKGTRKYVPRWVQFSSHHFLRGR